MKYCAGLEYTPSWSKVNHLPKTEKHHGSNFGKCAEDVDKENGSPPTDIENILYQWQIVLLREHIKRNRMKSFSE